jgi:hypothetical protein
MLSASFAEQPGIFRHGCRVRNAKPANGWIWGLRMVDHIAISGRLIITKLVGAGINGWARIDSSVVCKPPKELLTGGRPLTTYSTGFQYLPYLFPS